MAAALARLGLRPVKLVRVQFCPFEKNVESTRFVFWGGGRCVHARPSARVPGSSDPLSLPRARPLVPAPGVLVPGRAHAALPS